MQLRCSFTPILHCYLRIMRADGNLETRVKSLGGKGWGVFRELTRGNFFRRIYIEERRRRREAERKLIRRGEYCRAHYHDREKSNCNCRLLIFARSFKLLRAKYGEQVYLRARARAAGMCATTLYIYIYGNNNTGFRRRNAFENGTNAYTTAHRLLRARN